MTYHEARGPGAFPDPGPRPEDNAYSLRALDIDACATGARFPPGVHDAEVPALAPVGRVQLVAVGHVDLVGAPAAAHHVGICGVLVGQDQVASAPRDDPVVLAVADTLEYLVVACASLAGQHVPALDALIRGQRHRREQRDHYQRQDRHHHQLAHAPLLSRLWTRSKMTFSLPR